ncbi:hypothetical protein ANN_24671 [Periplaneta americana]|uniref:Transposase n=1 Tax=Periplaneta americana TaxID=6978 RepID=A0ABQ8S426_PERAM|nr:hypothetical protein ANN_24671 [Periplaneta americana]
MSSNILAVRAIPGRTLSTTRCRHPDCSELETLGHVLGQCPKGELLINARHHRVRHALAISLKTLNWEIHEEVHFVSSDGSFRLADIIAINGRLKRALVLDPTIRFERNLNQATEVDIEKKSIYEPCLPYLSQKYNVPLKQWSVIGLLFGSRGSITKFTWNYLKELHIPFDSVIGNIFRMIPGVGFTVYTELPHISIRKCDLIGEDYILPRESSPKSNRKRSNVVSVEDEASQSSAADSVPEPVGSSSHKASDISIVYDSSTKKEKSEEIEVITIDSDESQTSEKLQVNEMGNINSETQGMNVWTSDDVWRSNVGSGNAWYCSASNWAQEYHVGAQGVCPELSKHLPKCGSGRSSPEETSDFTKDEVSKHVGTGNWEFRFGSESFQVLLGRTLSYCTSAGSSELIRYRCRYYGLHNIEIHRNVFLFRKLLPSKETLRGHSDSSFRGEGYIQCCVDVRLCDMYSNQELAEIDFMYGKADGIAALARRLYQERYPQRQCPDLKTFVRLHYRLCEYGKFNSPGLGRGRPRSTTSEVQEEILEAVNMTPSISTRRVALQVNVPHTTAWRLLKEYQLYPYHLQRVQALSLADYPARVRFCQWFLQQCGVNPNFPALVLFTDEAQFTRDGITYFHNQHVWAYENPRATVPSHHQVRFSLNMWAGIIGDLLVGPHVLVNRLTGQAYTNFLENTIPRVLEDTPLINRQHIHFLHDGAPAHFSRMARRYLDRRFPDRWIGRGGPIAWPPCSPDLNPLDFYLWGHLKSLVYSSPVPDLESLRNRIVACSEDIRNTPGVWDRVRRSMRHRCEVCIEAGGGHFEHLL